MEQMSMNWGGAAKMGESTLPQDHEDQLGLGMRIIQAAFANKVQTMEQENRSLRLTCEEQRANCAALQKKNSALEVELVEGHQRSQQLAEENKELFKTVGQLRKQIGRLEHLKAAVMSSIQDDAEKEAEIGDTRALMSEEYIRSAMPLTVGGLGMQTSMPRELMAGTGMMGNSLMSMSTPGMYAPPPASSSMVDGKAFFRQARGQLSHEAFSQFLQTIKRLNNQQQTREETLEESRRLFGPENQALYADFESLLNKQGL
jgi:hypothetical protein